MNKANQNNIWKTIASFAVLGILLCVIDIIIVRHREAVRKQISVARKILLEQTKKHVVGEWLGDEENIVFHTDNTFTITKLKAEAIKKIYKGQYAVDRSGVFLRFFGSMHWPSEGNHKDKHTSIGARYLEMRDDSLLVQYQWRDELTWKKKEL